MKIKSYYAHRVEEAMAKASQELGPDAMLINTRKTTSETRHLGEYEVVFGCDAAIHSSSDFSGTDSVPAPKGDRLSAEVADLKRELEGIRRAITRSSFAPTQWAAAPPTVADAYSALAAAELAPELAQQVVQAAQSGVGEGPNSRSKAPRQDDRALEGAIAEELEARIPVEAVLGKNGISPRTIALVGPPGSGKTTTLVKLAVNYGIAARRPILLLSADTYRVAASEQLRRFAAILGVGFQVLETTGALAQALEENRGKDLIFIDTPGYGFSDIENGHDLAHFLSTRSDIDTQLVLPCSMKATDLTRMIDIFEVFRPHRLVFTRLDETATYGPILNEAVRTAKPLSFFATGQRIPEDLEAATRRGLADRILDHRVRALSAA